MQAISEYNVLDETIPCACVFRLSVRFSDSYEDAQQLRSNASGVDHFAAWWKIEAHARVTDVDERYRGDVEGEVSFEANETLTLLCFVVTSYKHHLYVLAVLVNIWTGDVHNFKKDHAVLCSLLAFACRPLKTLKIMQHIVYSFVYNSRTNSRNTTAWERLKEMELDKKTNLFLVVVWPYLPFPFPLRTCLIASRSHRDACSCIHRIDFTMSDQTAPVPYPLYSDVGHSQQPIASTSSSAASTAAGAGAASGSGSSQPQSRQAAEDARKDRTLAEFLVMLDEYEPLVSCASTCFPYHHIVLMSM